MLEAVLNISSPTSLEELAKAAAKCGVPERDVPGLAEIFSLSGPAQELELAVRRREAHAAAVRTLVSVHRRYPRAVLCFVDVDKFDHPSQKLVVALDEALDGGGARLLVTAANSKVVRSVNTLEVTGLSPEHALALASELAGDNELPSAKAIHSATSGSPQTIAQLAGWLKMGRTASTMPSQAVDIISMRISRLPAPARRVLQAVAINGAAAPRWLIEQCLDGSPPQPTWNDFDWTSLLSLDNEFLTFPSELVSQVVLACTPADVKRRLHIAALAAVEKVASAGICGTHAEGGGEHRRAYDYYLRAGHDAVRRFDDPGASRWYSLAAACADKLIAAGDKSAAALAVEALVLLAEVQRLSGQRDEALATLDKADGLRPDDDQTAAIHRSRSMIDYAAGNYGKAADGLQMAVLPAIRSNARNLLCQIYLDLSRALDQVGRRDEATAELTQAIAVLTRNGGIRAATGPGRLWRLGLVLAERHLDDGRVALAKETALDALAHVRRTGWAHARGRLSALMARICEEAGEHGSALRHRANAIDDLRQLGDRRSTAELLIDNAQASMRKRRLDTEPGVEWSSPEKTMRLANKLATEIGWDQGADAGNEKN
jgi:tetratricopeptide (TPR) repeat protein